VRLGKGVKVRIEARFARYFSPLALKGTSVIIDRVCASSTSRTNIMMRVINLWKKPQWLDADWLEFREENKNEFHTSMEEC